MLHHIDLDWFLQQAMDIFYGTLKCDLMKLTLDLFAVHIQNVSVASGSNLTNGGLKVAPFCGLYATKISR